MLRPRIFYIKSSISLHFLIHFVIEADIEMQILAGSADAYPYRF